MTFHDWAVPVTGLIALALSLYAPRARDKNMLRVIAAANFAWGVYLLLFDAITATVISIVAGINSLVSVHTESLKPAHKAAVRWSFMAINVIVVVMTWQGLHSLLPFIAVCVGAYATFWLRYERLRYGISLCILVWGLNSLYFHAWEGVTSCVLQLISQYMSLKKARLERLRDMRRERELIRAA